MMQKDFERLCTALVGRKTGKRTRTDLYVHRSVVERACEAEIQQLDSLWLNHVQGLDMWNVLRFSANCRSVSLLLYPGFYEVGHPALHASLKVSIDAQEARLTDFRSRVNRPILHRKELLVAGSDKWFPVFKALSTEEEEWGLLADSRNIGNESTWESVLKTAGAEIQGHRVVRAT
jgi:DNA phosphorothioation-associated putative methyltransferase